MASPLDRSTTSNIDNFSFLNPNVSPLHSAAMSGQKDILNGLGQTQPQNIDIVDENNRTPLHYAVIANNPECIDVLVKYSANVNHRDNIGRTAMHWACLQGNFKASKSLLIKSIDLRARDLDGRTALHYSTANSSAKILSLLVKRLKHDGLNDPDNQGMTALHWSAFNNNSEACRILIKEGADSVSPDNEGHVPIHQCASNTNTNSLKVLIELGGAGVLNLQDAQGCTLLHLAVSSQNIALLDILTSPSMNSNLNSKDHQYRTPLHWAAALGQPGIVALLLERGADFNQLDGNGYSPMHYAAERNYSDCIDAFLSFDFVTDVPDKEHRTSLMLSCQLGFLEASRTIIERRSESVAFSTPQTGLTALHYAVIGGSVACIKLLLQYSADVNVQDIEGRTPAALACEHGQEAALFALFEAGGRLDISTIDGKMPLHWAALSGQEDIIAWILGKGIFVNSVDMQGRTPLLYACYGGYLSCVTVLLDSMADVERTDGDGLTALHWATMQGHSEIVNALFEAGASANPMERTLERKTPLDYAIIVENPEIESILVKMGGVKSENIKLLAAIEIQRRWKGYFCKKEYFEFLQKSQDERKIRVTQQKKEQADRLEEQKKQLIREIQVSQIDKERKVHRQQQEAVVEQKLKEYHRKKYGDSLEQTDYATSVARSERKRLAIFRKKMEAALVIQLTWRRYLRKKNQLRLEESRRREKAKQTHAYAEEWARELAALTIQLAWRQYLRRKILREFAKKQRKLYEWSPSVMAARQRFLMTRIYSHDLKPVVYLPPKPKPPIRPAYTKFIPSPAALSFNFALEQYHPMFRGTFSVTSLSDYGKNILNDIDNAGVK